MLQQPSFEIRSAAEVRAEGRVIRGYPIVFNTLSLDLGGFKEIILPEAVDRTLRESLDVRALVDHSEDPSRVIGRRNAGTLRFSKDDHGLLSEIDMPQTTIGNDTLELVKRGDVTGMSFTFHVMPKGERFERRDGGPVRLISDMTIRDVALVTYPAYPTTNVEIAQRSLQAWQASANMGSRIKWLRQREYSRGVYR